MDKGRPTTHTARIRDSFAVEYEIARDLLLRFVNHPPASPWANWCKYAETKPINGESFSADRGEWLREEAAEYLSSLADGYVWPMAINVRAQWIVYTSPSNSEASARVAIAIDDWFHWLERTSQPQELTR